MDLNMMQCRINAFPGWRCKRRLHLEGPCALVPKWWNLKAWYVLKR